MRPEEKIRQQEMKIMQLVEESCIAQTAGDSRMALTKAKEASYKERSLIRMQEQNGLGEHHNIDLTYAVSLNLKIVLFNLANQYAVNELYTEALNTYQTITKNRMFANAYRLKLNMGNIYLKQGHYQMAVKMYRMALDQVPSTQKNLRYYLKLVVPAALMIGTFQDKNNAQHCHGSAGRSGQNENGIFASTVAIQDDHLHKYEALKRKDAEYCILTAAKLIAPFVEDSLKEELLSLYVGYDWCVSAIKSSEYAQLAADLEINKAIMFLKQNQLAEAISTLKTFEKDTDIALNAATNLSFIYYLQGDYDTALRYSETVEQCKMPTADGFVNYGACLIATGQLDRAIHCGNINEPNYLAGLCLKRQGHYIEALSCFQRFSGSLALLPAVVCQVASLLELVGDSEAAADTYQQLLGLTPTDAKALQKLGELFDQEGDKQQAHHYHVDSFRYYPGNLSVIEWLGSYYIEMQVVEKALIYFEKAALMQPGEPKWNMMVAGCHRRSGNMHKALTLYQEIHR
ncbi:hypothetical protein D910_05473 [Dendroctonus ponderosae]|uniref:Uncharacterized protein n=1 Tax=Dendroctonus ponderosae TaxID=77166 RepID=U4U2I3_DENPD|nr:hypothetical protein D910_05473 [Dendroctonus ponderosae]